MTQIAVKLPDELVDAVDELVAAGSFPSRSSAVRRALEVLVTTNRRAGVDLAYETGYRLLPDSEQELTEASRLAVQAINDEPWERWW